MNETIFNVFILEMDVITAYPKWVESQVCNNTDLIILAIFPVFLLGLQYWLLPFWLCKTIATAFLIPPLWVLSVSFLTYFRCGDN